MLTPYLPYPLVSGGQIRTYNLLKNLQPKHDITLFSLIKNEDDRQYIREIEPFCSKVQVFKRSSKPFTPKNILKTALSSKPFVVMRNHVSHTIKAVSQELNSNSYDLIHAETFYMMPNIPKTQIPTILVEQTIEYLGYQSYAKSSRNLIHKPFLQIDINKIKYWEKYYWQHADWLITMSQEDKDFIKRVVPQIKHIDVVANGVDIKFFNQVPKKLPKNPTILFVGTFSWLPNVHAVTYLVEKVWPLIQAKLPEAHLHIVGFQPTDKVKAFNQLNNVKVSGSVKDIRTAYAKAHVLVAPVRWGKGTRYKILEAMATKTPIVATKLAVEGINGIKDGHNVLIGDSHQDIADLTIKTLTLKKLQQKLSQNAYQLVSHQYNWTVISKQLDRVYQELGTKH